MQEQTRHRRLHRALAADGEAIEQRDEIETGLVKRRIGHAVAVACLPGLVVTIFSGEAGCRSSHDFRTIFERGESD